MIERSFDYRRIKRISDANPVPILGPWEIIASIEYFYLIEKQHNKDLGAWAMVPDPFRALRYLMHSALGPQCRGRRAIVSGLEAIRWLFANTYARDIVAPVPLTLRHAHAIPRAAGLRDMGTNIEGYRLYYADRENFAHDRRAA